MSFVKSLVNPRKPSTPSAFTSSSPGYRMSTQLDEKGTGVNSFIQRTGTAPQQAFDSRFPRMLGDIDTLRGGLTPGFSNLRAARLASVDNARNRAMGNLRENIALRRLSGSSFGEDTLIRAEREFAQAEADEQGKSFLEELNANLTVIREESAQVYNALQREMAEAGMSANFISTMGQVISNNQQFAEQAVLNQEAGAAKLAGTLAGFGLDRAFPSTSPTDFSGTNNSTIRWNSP